jgi:hypothetical protein
LLIANLSLRGKPAFLEDCTGATFFYTRSSQSTKLPDREDEFYREVLDLLAPEMRSKSLRKKYSSEDRGQHLPNVIGHYRQYKKVRKLSQPH